MEHLPIENTFNVISFLPFSTQAKVCKKTRDAIAPKMANIIKRSMKFNKRRIIDLLEDETDNVKVIQSAHCLFSNMNENELRKVIDQVLKYEALYPKSSIEIIEKGFELGWTNKKIHRHMIKEFDWNRLFIIGW